MSEMIHSASRRLAIKWRLHVELLSRYSRRSGVSTPSRPRRGQDFRKVDGSSFERRARASELEDRKIYFGLAEMEGQLSPVWQFTQNGEFLSFRPGYSILAWK